MNGRLSALEGAKDIRDELKRRLDWAIEQLEKALATRKELEEEISRLARERDALQNLLRFEEERWAPIQMGLPLARFAQVRLADACLIVLKEKGGEGSNEEIAKILEAGGFPFDQKNPKRVVHFCLIGLKAAGKVVSLGEGRWRLPS